MMFAPPLLLDHVGYKQILKQRAFSCGGPSAEPATRAQRLNISRFVGRLEGVPE